ncbi:MAG: tRNA (5-methylaminomethyl-2-thiouridylate)-methyltransferase [Candidatus Eisenbacteria bacterium]|nr:tRNA (5-methylaminomethyl-2-thiouridylate)-methyltransferase [Candidatus Eisenbacteria bacterium]
MTGIKALGLLSGGLDSTLAGIIMREQGVEVLGINFNTGFCLTDHMREMKKKNPQGAIYKNEALRAGNDIGCQIEIIDVSDEYVEVIKNPRHGYGSAMNPCIDCRIMMLRKAKRYMEEHNALFVFTGEVLGQRPMTQHRGTLGLIARESGLDRLLLRPLSARLLPPTIPEEKGWVDRSGLLSISGRSRKEQAALAAKYGLQDYPQPAGGCCFLTDKSYGRRLKDLFTFKGKDKITAEDMILLKVGRHFRISPALKVIVGRDESENNFLMRHKGSRSYLEPVNFPGPVTLAEGEMGEVGLENTLRLAARYTDGKDSDSVSFKLTHGGQDRLVSAKPFKPEEVIRWLIL